MQQNYLMLIVVPITKHLAIMLLNRQQIECEGELDINSEVIETIQTFEHILCCLIRNLIADSLNSILKANQNKIEAKIKIFFSHLIGYWF